MKIFLNGEKVDCGDARTIEQLLRRQRLTSDTTLVEHNGAALHRREWPERKLGQNDRVEILQVAAGG